MFQTAEPELAFAFIDTIGDLQHAQSIIAQSHFVRGPYRRTIARTVCLLHNNRLA